MDTESEGGLAAEMRRRCGLAEGTPGADRERRAAIMALPEAKGREAQAEHICTNTKLTVDEAKVLLATAAAPRVELVAEMKRRHGLTD